MWTFKCLFICWFSKHLYRKTTNRHASRVTGSVAQVSSGASVSNHDKLQVFKSKPHFSTGSSCTVCDPTCWLWSKLEQHLAQMCSRCLLPDFFFLHQVLSGVSGPCLLSRLLLLSNRYNSEQRPLLPGVITWVLTICLSVNYMGGGVQVPHHLLM